MVCDECGSDFPHLHRHHIIARSEGGTDEEANIRRLCPNCHTLVHGGSFGGPVLRERGRKKARKTLADEAVSAQTAGPQPARELVMRQQVALLEMERIFLPGMRLLSRAIEQAEEFAAQLDAVFPEPTWSAGKRYHLATVKFYADEWPIVETLMEQTGQNITDLLKSSVAKEAARHGLIFPRYGVPEEAAS